MARTGTVRPQRTAASQRRRQGSKRQITPCCQPDGRPSASRWRVRAHLLEGTVLCHGCLRWQQRVFPRRKCCVRVLAWLQNHRSRFGQHHLHTRAPRLVSLPQLLTERCPVEFALTSTVSPRHLMRCNSGHTTLTGHARGAASYSDLASSAEVDVVVARAGTAAF